MKMKASYETEVYLSDGDYFVIKQVDPMGEDAIVCLTHEQVKLLAEELRKWAKNGCWWTGVVREEHDAS